MPSSADESKLFLSHAEVKIDGTSIPEFMDAMRDISVEMTLNMPSMAVLRVHDEQLAWVDDSRLDVGKEIEISFGKQGETAVQPLFKGEIVSLEPNFTDMGAVMVIRAYDKMHRLGLGTVSKVFLSQKATDVVQTLASEKGLSAQVDTTSVVYESLMVDNESALAYIRKWADHLGMIMYVKDGTFHFKKAKSLGEVELEWGTDLTAFRPRVSGAAQSTKVTVRGWDFKQKKEIVAVKSSATYENKNGLITSSPNAKAKSAFAESPAVVLDQYVTSKSDADTAAQAGFDDLAYAGLEAEGTAHGNPDIIAGKTVKVTKAGTRFSGTYLVTSATHIYSGESGYMTEWRSEGRSPRTVADLVSTCDGTGGGGRSGRWFGLYTAIVTDNNDPENLMRVKVKFPWWDDQQVSFWVRVMQPGGGGNRGLVNLPEVNDEVLVGFEDGHIDRAYVLGGLFNGKDKPKLSASQIVVGGKVVLREWRTRTGHLIHMNDDTAGDFIEIIDRTEKFKIKFDVKNKKVEITNDKKKVEMDTSKITVESDADVEVKATSNIKITATGNVDVEATGNMNLKATGQMTIKGAIVNIN